MPTYDYECNECSHTFEHFQSMSSAKLRKCPSCGRQRLRRLIGSGAGVIFKGSGFYETDYKRKGGQGKSKSEQKSESASESTSDASSTDSSSTSSKKPAKKKDSASKSGASKKAAD